MSGNNFLSLNSEEMRKLAHCLKEMSFINGLCKNEECRSYGLALVDILNGAFKRGLDNGQDTGSGFIRGDSDIMG